MFERKDRSFGVCNYVSKLKVYFLSFFLSPRGRAFAHVAVGRRIDPSWGGPIELFLVPASAPRLV